MAASWQNTEAKATFERSDEVPDQRTALMCMLEDVIESSPIPDFAEIAKLALQILETAKDMQTEKGSCKEFHWRLVATTKLLAYIFLNANEDVETEESRELMDKLRQALYFHTRIYKFVVMSSTQRDMYLVRITDVYDVYLSTLQGYLREFGYIGQNVKLQVSMNQVVKLPSMLEDRESTGASTRAPCLNPGGEVTVNRVDSVNSKNNLKINIFRSWRKCRGRQGGRRD